MTEEVMIKTAIKNIIDIKSNNNNNSILDDPFAIIFQLIINTELVFSLIK